MIIIFGKCLLTTITSLSVATIVILGKVVIKRNIDKLKKEINIYHKFMTNMPKIEETYLKDKNLTQNLSPKATSCINNNVHRKNEYKEEDYLHTDYIFDINLMDSLSLQDLHQLLLNNQIITSLNDNQVFSIPNIKVKTLKPTKNNHSTEK